MRILFVGDVVGAAGRRMLKSGVRTLRASHDPDLVIVNGENAAGGAGLTPATADEIFKAGADAITTGNHIWDKREIIPYLESHDRIVRPANYPEPCPGRGACVVSARDGQPVAVVNLMGRVFMADLDDPFRKADETLSRLRDQAAVIVVDMHAEATSEKLAMGWHLAGRATAVIGTHTHVATADARVLAGGTAFITDVGMTGPHDSIIGVEKAGVLQRFLTQRPASFVTAEGDPRLNGVVVDCDGDGRAYAIERVELAGAPAGDAP